VSDAVEKAIERKLSGIEAVQSRVERQRIIERAAAAGAAEMRNEIDRGRQDDVACGRRGCRFFDVSMAQSCGACFGPDEAPFAEICPAYMPEKARN
jgi:hypothetical protein